MTSGEGRGAFLGEGLSKSAADMTSRKSLSSHSDVLTISPERWRPWPWNYFL